MKHYVSNWQPKTEIINKCMDEMCKQLDYATNVFHSDKDALPARKVMWSAQRYPLSSARIICVYSVCVYLTEWTMFFFKKPLVQYLLLLLSLYLYISLSFFDLNLKSNISSAFTTSREDLAESLIWPRRPQVKNRWLILKWVSLCLIKLLSTVNILILLIMF